MICPAWEDCNKKACIEQYVCMNLDYWSQYWQNQKNSNTEAWQKRHKSKKERKRVAKADHFKDTPPCIKTGISCDKKEACDVLSQCVVTLKVVSDNPILLNALRGPLSAKQICTILRDNNISPMKSYYYHTKYWNGKEKGKEAQ